MTEIIRTPSNYTADVTSNPLHVCDCSVESTQECFNFSQTIKKVETYPGRKFNLSVVAVGQLLANTTVLSGVPSPIYASLLPHSNSTIPQTMLIQNGKRHCSNLTYSINSAAESVVMILAIENNNDEYFDSLWKEHAEWQKDVYRVLRDDLVLPAYVEIDLLPCPVGFELSLDDTCACSTALNTSVMGCSIDTILIERKPSYWIEAIPQEPLENSSSVLYLTHSHCPYDYCRPGAFQFSLADSDAQCNHNRSGIICGGCKPGHSLILGGTECWKCTNIHLLLLLPFALAGILLIVFLSLTDMTVTAGTINGLLFYANIVIENKATFFPPATADGFLFVFMAWLNLDFGIKSCFFDGLDAYAFTWLQLSFPAYISLLAIGIIIACRHIEFVRKLCGPNIVPVLATLFLLSYTKVQKTIATNMSFTVVQVSNGETIMVWLKDSNLSPHQGRRIIPLLLFTIFITLAFLAYTFSILLGPWLQRKTHYRVFRWVLKLKPLFDAYFGPLKDHHRYWTGVLLLSRMVLSLVSTVNVLGDDSINLVAIVLVSVLLLWWSGKVYKSRAPFILDSLFHLNLAVLALITLFNKLSPGGSQYVTICVSTGSAFAIFCGILLYHCLKRLKKFHTMRFKLHPLLGEGHHFADEDSDEDILNVIDSHLASSK